MEMLTSRRNPLAVHIKRLGADRNYRRECGEFLCDGIKLLEEAVKCEADIVAVLTSSHIPFPLSVDARVYHASRDIIDSLSPLKNAQDTLFTCKTPPSGGFAGHEGAGMGAHILLDGIQDPGNLGAIIRTADALSFDSVITTGKTADLYNPKTIRATMGAVFRQKVHSMSISELAELKNSGVAFLGAVSGEGCASIYDVKLKNAVIAIGSEGQGLTADVLSLCSEVFTIPIAPHCESLNAAVAAGIVMWEAVRVES